MLIGVGYLEQVVVGNILGDAWMERKSLTSNARLRYSQVSPKHDERFYFTFNFYAMYCNGPSTSRTRTDPRTGYVGGSNMFTTRAIPFFTDFYNLFYVNGTKVVPQTIGLYLTPIALAHWIMDNGGLNNGLVLNTQGFSLAEVELLVNALNTNFGVHSYMRYEKKLPTIYITKKELPIIATAVISYMHPSTHYKLGL